MTTKPIWRPIPWAIVAYAMAFFAISVIFNGCATQRGLDTPGIKRWCTEKRCFVQASPEVVHARCTGKKSGWIGWDEGGAADDQTKRASACTSFSRKFQPGRGWLQRRYRIWFSEWTSVPHEERHIEIYEKDGGIMIPEHHKALHAPSLNLNFYRGLRPLDNAGER